jgi:choline kinase
MGSRLELNMPKCMVEVHGRRVIDYLLDLLKDVQNVRVVVGFMEHEVIDYVRKIRKDVVFVRNPQFQTTSNSYSLWLATRDLTEPFIAIDGDMLIEPASFEKFLKVCDGTRSIIGIAESKTEEAVFVELDDEQNIVAFYRNPRTQYEWCGIACLGRDTHAKQPAGVRLQCAGEAPATAGAGHRLF